MADSQTHQVSKAIDWIRKNFARPLCIDVLAQAAHMSTSSLHHNFKAVTAAVSEATAVAGGAPTDAGGDAGRGACSPSRSAMKVPRSSVANTVGCSAHRRGGISLNYGWTHGPPIT